MPLNAFERTLLECSGVSPNEVCESTEQAVSAALTQEAERIRSGHFDDILLNVRLVYLFDENVALEQRSHRIEELVQGIVDRQDLQETLFLLSFGVAALLSYVRDNVTGQVLQQLTLPAQPSMHAAQRGRQTRKQTEIFARL